jgi:hypothetical protein
MRHVFTTLLVTAIAAFSGTPTLAQQVTGDQDGSSQQVEESDEAYRRRMELEDARRRDPTYTDPAVDYRREQEKIDALPQESRENIRDQLVDVIVQNPEWQPEDALADYPYEPTAAAQADPELKQQEQEAWDEQIEKYHAREAAAFGTYRGQAGGPGNPDGPEGGADGAQPGQSAGQQGSRGGQQGGQGSESSDATAGTYQPYSPQSGNRDDAESTEGVSESALEFLMKQQAGSAQAPAGSEQAQASQESQQQAADEQVASQQAAQSQSASSQDESEAQPTQPDMRGIIAIEDLDKLEGTVPGGMLPVTPEEEDEEERPDGGP